MNGSDESNRCAAGFDRADRDTGGNDMTANTIERNDPTTAEAVAATPTERTRSGRVFRPGVDIVERKDALLVHADMPGARPDEIDVQFQNGMLTIVGRVRPRQPEGTSFLVREYGVGDFERTFQVSEKIDVSRVTADYQHGVLTLRLPKSEAAMPRRITVAAK
jgi:HSP20 family molecular chaperone IbpA